MTTYSRFARLLAAAICVAIPLTLGVADEKPGDIKPAADNPAGEKPATEKPAAEQSPAERLLDVLDQKTSLDAKGLTLEKLAELLTNKYGILVEIDIKGLEDVGGSKDTEVGGEFKALPLDEGLRRILSEHELGIVVRDEMLSLTSAERSRSVFVTRLYDVNDLSPATSRVPGVADDGEWLVQVITTTVQPSTWEATGGPGSILWNRGMLVISQELRVQRMIAEYLRTLRSIRDRQKAGDERPFMSDGKALESRRKVLDRRCHLDFTNQPLAKVAEIIHETYDVSVEIDRRGLDDVGATPEATASARYRNISLRSALRVILGAHDLAPVFRDDALVITSAEKASQEQMVVLYPVRSLIELMSPGADAEEKMSCMEELISMITCCVEPSSWEAVGGPGSIRAIPELDLLVFSQMYRIHEQTDELLTRLRNLYAARKAQDAKQPESDEPKLAVYMLAGHAGFANSDVFSKGVADTVRKFVAPDSWKDEKSGVWMGTLSDRLIVRQRPTVQREVAALLKKLSVLGDPPLSQMSGQGGGGAAF